MGTRAMIRFHPQILLIDVLKAAEHIGCRLYTDCRGRLVVAPLADARPINPERHGNSTVLPIRDYRRINAGATPRPEVAA